MERRRVAEPVPYVGRIMLAFVRSVLKVYRKKVPVYTDPAI